MDQAASGPGQSLYNWLGARVRRLVRWWRRLDALVNQPLPENRSLFWSLLAPFGYPWFVPILTVVLIAAMALGPTFRTQPADIALLALGLVLLLCLHAAAKARPAIQRYLLAGQLAILGILALPVAVFSVPETFGDSSGAPRLHVGVAATIAMAVALGAVWWIARGLFRAGGNTLAEVLPEVELFAPHDRYDFMGRSPAVEIWSALGVVPVRYPIELLLPGSLLVLFVPDRYLVPAFLVSTAAAWLALFLGTLFERLSEVLNTIGRLFFVGPQRAISVVVIVVAVLRLLDVHYVTYLFNAGSGGYGNVTIMLYVALTYVSAWYYAYWGDQFVARRLIRMLAPTDSPATPLSIEYPYRGNPDVSAVDARGRSISLHGAGRFKVEGRYRQGYETSGPALQFLTAAELLGCFRAQIQQNRKNWPGGQDPLPGIRLLQRSATIYPVVTGTLALLLIGAPAVVAFNYSVQPPELAIHEASSKTALEPSGLLFGSARQTGECPPLGPDEPRIAVVASGGGTRSAIYTASMLRGLAEQGRICNVVLASGVSGGSAALAYFALHERELRRPGGFDDTQRKAWQKFVDTMGLPYIEYVLDGASDQRIVFGRYSWQPAACGEPKADPVDVKGWMPARSRVGNILAESFVCKMGAGVMAEPSFGLLLNTSMLGFFDTNDACAKGKGLALPEGAAACRNALNGTTAGGRLVLTNLAAAAPDDVAVPDSNVAAMQIKQINDGSVSIARAAALSANFPPVFSDAAIDVMSGDGGGVRYWVTDGGAVENRGAMTLYLAIRKAARSMTPSDRLAPLHIVIADVSAAPGRYSESFGVNSVLAAGGQLGLAMEGEVFSDIKETYCGRGATLLVHDITMPPVLRNGGIGTHWLLPGTLTFQEPREGSTARETLPANDVKRLIVALHSDEPPMFESTGAQTVLGWARSGNDHDGHWRDLLGGLANPLPAQGCANRQKGGAYTIE